LKQILNNLSKRLGLTSTEVNVLLFVTIAFVIGAFGKYFKYKSNIKTIRKFNYSKQDSLFLELNKRDIVQNTDIKNIQKRVDSKPELLDFRTKKKDIKKKNVLTLTNSSININTANLNTLIRLPGIGIKTAKRIIELREKRIKFNSLNDLLDVKGIGHEKLKKIKKYLFIEK
jgi:competence protein ComEA